MIKISIDKNKLVVKKISQKKNKKITTVDQYKHKYIDPIKMVKNSVIPKVIVSSIRSHSDTISENIRKVQEVNRIMNISYNYKVFDDKQCKDFIMQYYGEYYCKLYDKLIPGAYKSDFFRYLYIYKKGGVWLDINKQLIVKIQDIIDMIGNQGFLFCEEIPRIENSFGGIFQAFFCSAPGNLLLKKCIEQCVHNIRHNNYGVNPLEPTGPICIGKKYKELTGLKISESDTIISCKNINSKFIELKGVKIISLRPFKRCVSPYDKLWHKKSIYRNNNDQTIINYQKKRLEFYLGKTLCNVNRYNITKKSWGYEKIENMKKATDDYRRALYKLCSRTKHTNKVCCFTFGDVEQNCPTPCLLKNRLSSDNNSTVLFSLQTDRHWGIFYRSRDRKDFENKLDKLIWRGSTTVPTKIKKLKKSYRANRFHLFDKWGYMHNTKTMNIGFNNFCQSPLKGYRKYKKSNIGISEFRKYKYILSIEGNDKDSGLQWKLDSNSVVLMPKPTVETWLMESHLRSGIHYVEIKNDFSDLVEKLNWCKSNQNECKNIIENAHIFLDQFRDKNEQYELERKVISEYFKRTN